MTSDVSEVCTHHNPSFAHDTRLDTTNTSKMLLATLLDNGFVSSFNYDLTNFFLAAA